MKKLHVVVLCCAAFLFAFSPIPQWLQFGSQVSAALPQGTVIIQLEPLLTGLSSPVYVTNAHDGSRRLFIIEQPGRIKVLQPASASPTVFLDITTKVLSGGERGLLGLAFHPQFKTNRRFFVNYTRQTDGATVIAEYKASASNANLADTAETILLTIAQPFANHNGGMIEFGSDGFLYIGMGDGGSANDPGNRAQNTQELLGKILRIDVDHPNGNVPYSSPSTNPYFGADPGRDEIYAIGLRNPWRFSFDRATGQLYVADVGQGAWEEVDIITRGGNYGWRVFEGNHCTNLDPALCNASNFIAPIAEYNHSAGRCSITGGYVYRGTKASLPLGAYVYADYCTGEIFLLQGNTQTLLLDTSLSISSFGEDEAGEIYVVGLGGTVQHIVNPSSPSSCTYALSTTSQTVIASGGIGNANLTAGSGCLWTASSNAAWLTITSTMSGSGNTTISYSVAANTTPFSRTGTISIGGQSLAVIQAGQASSVSAASYTSGQASEAIASIFGVALATTMQGASTNPLPILLAGSTVRVKDSTGNERFAPLFFVSPNQINYQIPPQTASGPALVTVTSGDGTISTAAIQVTAVAPGIFTLTANGQGMPAAQVQRVKADNSQTFEPIAQFNTTQNQFVAIPIDLGPPTDNVFLVLYGTGIRFCSSLLAVTAKIGGEDAQVTYAGLQPDFVGLDQVNARLSRSLIGRGEVDVVLMVDGQVANTVRINIK